MTEGDAIAFEVAQKMRKLCERHPQFPFPSWLPFFVFAGNVPDDIASIT